MPEVKVPELAESITEGTIAEWLKNVRDSVEKGEAILELETDKVNVEVVSEEAGVLSEQLASERRHCRSWTSNCYHRRR
ncbi:biotin/lipoyl-containing protein [Staphylococcus aureus]|nr:biotin/lipoyl-containing protein [Staphylococcus aureus]